MKFKNHFENILLYILSWQNYAQTELYIIIIVMSVSVIMEGIHAY